MKALTQTFLTGLFAVLPIGVTAYILYWLVASTETFLRRILDYFFPGRLVYFPGMGIILFVAVVFLIGLLLRSWTIRAVFRIADWLLKKIPLVKTLYGAVTDLMSLFAGSKDRGLSQVVMVRLGDTEMRLIGFLTREDFSDLPAGIGGPDTVAVYLPMSYQLGGFTTMVPRSSVESIDMPMEAAMRFAIAAGVQETKLDPD